ncbi:MAG: DUF4345 domain-containing protein [Cyanobacteriota bacterium]|nr:DUF4345 domain-containing protein [Cyanobacteriota bacterium]
MKRGLQIILAILSGIPIWVGLLGITQGLSRWLPDPSITPDFDSHYRYITGYYLSLGMIGLWVIPRIEEHTSLFRIIGISVFLGGVGRVVSIWQVGIPSPMMLIFTGLELAFPLLILWQAQIARKPS